MSDNRVVSETKSRPFVCFKRLFTPEECLHIIRLAEVRGCFEDGKVWNEEFGKFVVDKQDRRVLASYHERGMDTQWIFEIMDKAFHAAASVLNIRIRKESEEDIKIMSYGIGDHFKTWHKDSGSDYDERRAMSMTVQLSHLSTYDGGRFQIHTSNLGDFEFNTQMGSAIAFCSNTLHRVTPVTSGVRFSLVNWIGLAR